ncbi:unknown [Clostridium sp. CAG:510]|nr:unknown [Clostridium sp. CAG:510]
MLLFYLLLQPLDNGGGGIHADVTHDKNFFQLFIEILVYGGKSVKNRVNTIYNIVPGFFQPDFQFGKKSHFFFTHSRMPSFIFSLSPLLNCPNPYQSD